jgi:hypothetical protein
MTPFHLFIAIGVVSWLILPPRCETCGAERRNIWSLDNPKIVCKCEPAPRFDLDKFLDGAKEAGEILRRREKAAEYVGEHFGHAIERLGDEQSKGRM